MKILRDFLAQLLFVLLSVAGFSNHAIGQGTTDISGYIFTGAKVSTDFSIVGGDVSKYIRGDGTPSTMPAQVQSDWNQSTSSATDFIKNKPSMPTYYGSAGAKTITKIWTDVITPSTASGYSIDISSAGFTTINSIIVVAAKNTSSAGTSPQVSIKSYTTSAVVINVTEASAATQSVLINLIGGVTNVLTGSPLVFANTSGLTIHITVYGS